MKKQKNSVLCGAALQFHGIFSGLHAGIGSRNRTADESPLHPQRVRVPPESASGNEAAAVLNGLYAALPVTNGVKEVATAEELTAALENNANDTVKLTADITIGTTLTVSRTVTLDLNGNVLK